MMADQRTMAQLLQAPTESYEDAIVVPAITADNFELKHGPLTLVQNKQFFRHDKEDPHAHVLYFNKITSTLKFPKVSNRSIKLMIFPFSLEGAARIWVEKEPPRSIFTWDDLVLKFINKFFPLSKTTNLQLHQLDTIYNALNSKDQDSLNSAASGNFLDKMPRECLAIIEIKSKVRYSRNKPVVAKVSTNATTSGISPDVAELKDMAPAYQALAPQTQGVSKEDFLAYVKANYAVMRNMQTQGQNIQNQLTNLTDLITKFVNSNSASTSSSGTLPSNTIANPRSAPKAITTRSGVSYDGPQIPPLTFFLPRVVENKPEATKDTVNPTNNESTEDVQPQVVQSESPILTFEPVTSPIFEPANTLVSASKPNRKASIPYPSRRNNERNREKANNQIKKFYQSFEISFADALIFMPKFASTLKALIGNKEKLSMAECLALVDLDASINLMPFSYWKGLSLPDLTPTCMTSRASRSFDISSDFDDDPRVSLILERSFLKTGRGLIDVFEGELTLRVGKEAITFNQDQTSRYSANYSDMTAKRIDVIDMACKEYSQEVLDEPTSSEFYQPYLDPEGDILLLEAFLDDDPSLPPLNQRNYLPKVHKELKICEAKSDKSSVDEPPVVELKDLPPHLEYAFLEGNDELPVIIAKYLSVEEKTALITVLKSHKRAIAWKLSDIKGINPEFCTHKILMEEDFEPSVQHQRRVNSKIHDVIKQEVIKLLEAGLIYPISDSPWEKTTFTCPYGTFAYRRMPFGLCNAPGTFQSYLSHLERMLKRCEDTNLCLNWEKSYFMVKEGIVLGHKISKQGIDVDKEKVDVITKLPHPTTFKGIRSFFGHAGFYRRFIKDFSKIARPMTRLLEKDTPFIFSQECVDAFQTLKRKLTEAPILIALNWDMPFELMCDASDFAISQS
uniref:Uncharacterized protein n=1 Tax=Tanacetum cinerariifolium TaxID=118510 RepID=A0A6L2LSZ4_TANCI|nr:hypothetical protein [Tanacetum cinerariifolium]